MDDLKMIINPENVKSEFIPEKIQHYPIINAKLNVLKGEEIKREFNYRVVVTNPTAISEVEEEKKKLIFQQLQELVQNEQQSEEEFQEALEKIDYYYTYEYQDYRETTANCLLSHYTRKMNLPVVFNSGFDDAMNIGEEIYQCDIVGGEPIVERINPEKIRIFRSGYSNRIEDADLIVLEDYWSKGKILDRWYDVLSPSDYKKLDEVQDGLGDGVVDGMDNIDERYGFVHRNMVTDEIANSFLFFDPHGDYSDGVSSHMLPYDEFGNIRVIRVYWKSQKKIKKVKWYDENGDEQFDFFPENHIINESLGEEEETFWVNEAWEGTKIGKDIYVNIRPMPVQYNNLNNPSVCHFGIIGSIYNMNDDKPYSLVDMMKPYNYLYDVIHDRLNKLMARNWGKMARFDFAKKPKGWTVDKWIYYARNMGLYIEDSFNEGTYGQATGKIAASFNNNSNSVIDADFGNNIQQYINLLEYIKQNMQDVVGISKQREGQISNRETVGGVERATLQSSHITEWIFTIHDDLKRRVLEALLETAKVAYKGRTKTFWYILPDMSRKMIELDGDIFAENCYGLVVEGTNNIADLNQKLEGLAQAALQNQTLTFGTIMKLFTSASFSEKQRMIEADEKKLRKEAQQQQQQQMQMQQQQIQAQQQAAQMELQFKDQLNQRDNETKIAVAQINSQAELAVLQLKNDMAAKEAEEAAATEYSQESKDKLMLEMKKLDEEMKFKRENLSFQKDKADKDRVVKEKQVKAQAARRAAQK